MVRAITWEDFLALDDGEEDAGVYRLPPPASVIIIIGPIKIGDGVDHPDDNP